MEKYTFIKDGTSWVTVEAEHKYEAIFKVTDMKILDSGLYTIKTTDARVENNDTQIYIEGVE